MNQPMKTNKDHHLNMVFHALADPTRRKLIETLFKQEKTILELADLFDISFQGVAKHLTVLNKANLVKKHKKGKYQVCTYNPEPMVEAIHWISDHHELWNHSFESLENMLVKQGSKKKK